MGEHYQVPHFLHKLHPHFRTPYAALAIFTLLACLVVVLSRGKIIFLADLYNFGAQIAFFSAHMSLIVLRLKNPQLQRPFKAPFNIPVGKGRSIPLTAIIGALATFAVWLIVVITKPDGRNLGFIWLGLGIAMYLYYRKKKRIAPLGTLSIEKIKIPAYQPMHLKHILVTARSEGNTDALQTACQMAKSSHAKIAAIHVLEIAPAIPMHAELLDRERVGEAALKRAEAVAHEYGLSIELKLIRARKIENAILDLISQNNYDMVIVGTRKDELKERNHFAVEVERLLKDAPCRIIFCKS